MSLTVKSAGAYSGSENYEKAERGFTLVREQLFAAIVVAALVATKPCLAQIAPASVVDPPSSGTAQADTSAPKTPPPAKPKTIGDPHTSYYPERALRMHIRGEARVKCMITAESTLDKCEVLSESPLGFGFGETAIKVVMLYRMKPMMRDGHPVDGGVVIVPMRFQLPGDPSTPRPPPSP
jgi:TonB family protein